MSALAHKNQLLGTGKTLLYLIATAVVAAAAAAAAAVAVAAAVVVVEHQVLSSPLIHGLAEAAVGGENYPRTQKAPPLPSFH